MTFSKAEREIAGMNPYTGWYELSVANKKIEANPELKKRLDQLGVGGTDNIAVARVIGAWKFDASIGNKEARDALVLAGGFMYGKWDSTFPTQESRVFIAAKASAGLLSLDKQIGKPSTTYGQDAFNDVILPAVLLGGKFDEKGQGQFIQIMEAYAVESSPYHNLNGRVGLRELIASFRGRVSERLKEIVNHIPSTSDVKRLISKFIGSAHSAS